MTKRNLPAIVSHFRTRQSQFTFALLGALILLGTSPLRAASLFIDDTNPNDTVTLSVNDFDNGGFFVNGMLMQQGLGRPSAVTLSEANSIDFAGDWLEPVAFGDVTRTVYLIEGLPVPGTPTLISDILEYSVHFDRNTNVASISGRFTSDFEDNLGALPVVVDPRDVFVENGSPVFFNYGSFKGAVLADASVPEPSTFTLAALGILGLVARARRRRS